MALLTRLQQGDRRFALDDGRFVEIELATPIPKGASAEDLLAWLVQHEALRPLAAGFFARVKLRLPVEKAPLDEVITIRESVGWAPTARWRSRACSCARGTSGVLTRS